MEFLAEIKAQIPDYAKDIRLNLDGVIARSSLAPAPVKQMNPLPLNLAARSKSNSFSFEPSAR